MHGGVRGAGEIDLRERTERALAGDADLVAALDRLHHLAFDGHPALKRVLELALRRGVADAFARQPDAAAGRDHHGADAIADRELDVAIGVLQLGDIKLRLAFAADVDERHFRPDPDDGALDRLSAIELARLDGRFEHRCEIFFLIAHCHSLEPSILVGTALLQSRRAISMRRLSARPRSLSFSAIGRAFP